MACTMRPCDSDQLRTINTPWDIRVTVNRCLVRKFRRACRKAKRLSNRRAFVGRVSRRAVRLFGRRAPKFFRKRTEVRGWRPGSIDSYNCRKIRGSSTWSRHALGAAWDFFKKTWQERVDEGVDVWGPTDAPPWWFRRVFKQRGFTAGADWSGRKDYPHIEWSSNSIG